MLEINKNPAWFRTASRCRYSNLPVSHPALYISKHPGTNYFIEIAKLGDQILLVKGSGNVRSYEMAEAMDFMDEYVSKYFDIKASIFLIENYADIGRVDFKARKLYIDHHKNSEVFWGGVFYKMSLLMRISFKIAQRLHIQDKKVSAVDSFEQAIGLALEIISQRDSEDSLFNDSGSEFFPVKEIESSKNNYHRLTGKLNGIAGNLANKLTGFLTRRYSGELLKYIESIDWQRDGSQLPEINRHADKSVRKVFEAISYIKSEIDDFLKERDVSEKVLQESEARYRQLVEHARAGILTYDYSANRIISVNDSFLDITGYSKEEIFSVNPLRLMTEESQKIFAERLVLLRAGKNIPHEVSYQLITKQNKIKWILLNPRIIFKHQQPHKANVVITDITHLKKIESELLVYQSKLKQLSIRMSKSEETQRRHLASQLHESVSQELFVAQLKLNAVDKSLDDPEYSRQLDEIKAQIVKSIREIRGITYDLSPPVLYDLGLKDAVELLSKSIEAKHRLTVKSRFRGSLDHLDDDMKIIIYRIIKEIIHNSIKHARADCINIIIDNTNNHLSVDVSDNGVGFDPGSVSKGYYTGDGFGLFDIREKINHLNGRLAIHSTPGSGTRIGLSVPLNPARSPKIKSA